MARSTRLGATSNGTACQPQVSKRIRTGPIRASWRRWAVIFDGGVYVIVLLLAVGMLIAGADLALMPA
nr:hypothetical protein [Actinomycetota bacterium]